MMNFNELLDELVEHYLAHVEADAEEAFAEWHRKCTPTSEQAADADAKWAEHDRKWRTPFHKDESEQPSIKRRAA